MTASRPLIGLTLSVQRARSGVWDVEAAFLHRTYLDRVREAGGIPVLLPPQPPEDAAAVLSRIDGLLVTGGVDVAPARYGQRPGPSTEAPNLERDAWEDALLEGAIEHGIPFLGICRGIQLLNVHRGGTLLQHLPDELGHDRYSGHDGVFSLNEASVVDGSELAELVGADASIDVRSYHHQAIDRVGEGLAVTARSSDGVVQAVELEGVPFGLGVQWHPEQDDDLRLFRGLVEAARVRRDGPAAEDR